MGRKLIKYRVIRIATFVVFSSMWLLNSKAYCVFAIYPVLFASGSFIIESLLKKKPILTYVVATIVLIPSCYFIAEITSILPIKKYVEYSDLKEKNGRIELTGNYADMLGWEEQVKLVDSLYQTLIPRENCILWAGNYREAGALKY